MLATTQAVRAIATCPPQEAGSWVWGWLLALGLWAMGTGSLEAQPADPGSRLPEAPSASPPGGVYASNVVVTLAAPRNDSDVVFTLTGQDPVAQSPRWTGSLVLTNSAWLRWREVQGVTNLGPVRSEHYTLLDSDLVAFTSNLPLAIIDTQGTELNRDRKDQVMVRFVEAGSSRTTLVSPANFAGHALVNIRGRASLRYPKRSYTLKLIDESGEDRAASLMGLPKDEDFILYAPYPDKTLMRDVLAYELGNAMGHWAPRTRFLEVFVTDGTRRLSRQDYVGVYVLEERIKRHKSRVNIAKLTPADVSEPAITGGYVFKKDHVDRGYYGPPDLLGGGVYQSSSTNKTGFPTAPGGFPADPKGFLPTYRSSSSSTRSKDSSESSSSSSSRRSRQAAPRPLTNLLTGPIIQELEGRVRSTSYNEDGEEFIERMELGFQTTLRTNQFYWVEPEEDEVTPVQRDWLKRHLDRFEKALYDPDFLDPERGYAAFIDPASFIDYHLLVEVTKNVDGHRFSTFYTKDRGGKIRLEPMWDWNLSFGNCNGKQGWIPEYWFWPQLNEQEYTWFRRLFEDPDFGQRYVDRWGELRETLFATSRLMSRIDELVATLNEAQERNFQQWPILGQGVNPNYFIGETYQEEVDWMKDWLTKRLAWMEAQFVARPSVKTSSESEGQFRLQARPDQGELYYTLDGQDPRSAGGKPLASARVGACDAKVATGAQFVGRVLLDGRWSPPTRWIAR
jgi:hypothetical protein